jgi:hypothetical protein
MAPILLSVRLCKRLWELSFLVPRLPQYKAQELNFNSWFRVHLTKMAPRWRLFYLCLVVGSPYRETAELNFVGLRPSVYMAQAN